MAVHQTGMQCPSPLPMKGAQARCMMQQGHSLLQPPDGWTGGGNHDSKSFQAAFGLPRCQRYTSGCPMNMPTIISSLSPIDLDSQRIFAGWRSVAHIFRGPSGLFGPRPFIDYGFHGTAEAWSDTEAGMSGSWVYLCPPPSRGVVRNQEINQRSGDKTAIVQYSPVHISARSRRRSPAAACRLQHAYLGSVAHNPPPPNLLTSTASLPRYSYSVRSCLRHGRASPSAQVVACKCWLANAGLQMQVSKVKARHQASEFEDPCHACANVHYSICDAETIPKLLPPWLPAQPVSRLCREPSAIMPGQGARYQDSTHAYTPFRDLMPPWATLLYMATWCLHAPESSETLPRNP